MSCIVSNHPSAFFFWLSMEVFRSEICWSMAFTEASISFLRCSLPTLADICISVSACMTIPPLKAGAAGCEKASVALLLCSEMPQACVTTSDMPHTTLSMPSVPGSTAICRMLGARLTMLPASPTPSRPTSLPLIITRPEPPSRSPLSSTLPMIISGAEMMIRWGSR